MCKNCNWKEALDAIDQIFEDEETTDQTRIFLGSVREGTEERKHVTDRIWDCINSHL